MKRSLKKVRFGGDEFVTTHKQKSEFHGKLLPCRKNHCRGCSIVDSIKSSMFCGSH